MMGKKTILLIDDDVTMHAIFKTMLEPEWNVLYAFSAQSGIDILADNTIHLLLLDIQMPEVSGLDLLESIMIDTTMRNIPVIIVTGDPSIEVRRKANHLGAISFISKEILITNRKEIIEIIRDNMMIEGFKIEIDENAKTILRQAIKVLIQESKDGDLFSACNGLSSRLIKAFDLSYISFWTLPHSNVPNLVTSMGSLQPKNFGPNEIIREKVYQKLVVDKEPYLTNNPKSAIGGAFAEEAISLQLASEIGVPIYKMTRNEYYNNKMKVSSEMEVIGFIVMKRNRVFTTKEYQLIVSFLIQSGIVLYAIYINIMGETPKIY